MSRVRCCVRWCSAWLRVPLRCLSLDLTPPALASRRSRVRTTSCTSSHSSTCGRCRCEGTPWCRCPTSSSSWCGTCARWKCWTGRRCGKPTAGWRAGHCGSRRRTSCQAGPCGQTRAHGTSFCTWYVARAAVIWPSRGGARASLTRRVVLPPQARHEARTLKVQAQQAAASRQHLQELLREKELMLQAQDQQLGHATNVGTVRPWPLAARVQPGQGCRHHLTTLVRT